MRTVFTLVTMLFMIEGFSQDAFRFHVKESVNLDNSSVTKLTQIECHSIDSFSTAPNNAIGLDNEGTFLWVSFSTSSDEIIKMDMQGNIVDSIALPSLPAGVIYDDMEVSGTKLWVIAESPAKLFEVNLVSKVVTEIALPAFGMEPYHYFSCAFDGQFLWVLNYQTPTFETRLYKMDTASYAILDSVDLGHPVVTIEMVEDEMWGYCVASCFPEQMFRINTATGNFTDSSEWCITGSPYGMAWDGHYLWQTAALNQLIHKVDIGLDIGIPSVASSAEPVLTIFPNPASSMIEISTGNNIGILIIRNWWGAEVHRITMVGKNVTVSINHFSSGLYSASLYDEEKKIVSAVSFAVQ